MRKANVRYPADAQRAFEKYACAAVLHYNRALSHAKVLHAYNVDLREFKFATIKDAKAQAAAKDTMAEKYRVLAGRQGAQGELHRAAGPSPPR